MKCKECEFLKFAKGNGDPNRYYCEHPVACKEFLCGAVLVCRAGRVDDAELKIKTVPRWCPINGKKNND